MSLPNSGSSPSKQIRHCLVSSGFASAGRCSPRWSDISVHESRASLASSCGNALVARLTPSPVWTQVVDVTIKYAFRFGKQRGIRHVRPGEARGISGWAGVPRAFPTSDSGRGQALDATLTISPGQRRLEGVVRHKFCQMASESNHGHLRIVGAIAGVGSGEVSKLLLGSELAGLVLTSNRVLLQA